MLSVVDLFIRGPLGSKRTAQFGIFDLDDFQHILGNSC
jgi:hypothetical protein